MKVACYAPPLGSPSGVANYASVLHGELGKHVEIVHERSGVALYHIGNNPLHREIYAQALAVPGVVILHDGVLHHFLLGILKRDAYIEEFVYNYGEWMRGFAVQLWEERAGAASDARYFSYPMTRRIAERSRTVIVHNPAAARSVFQHAPNTNVVEIPHFFVAPQVQVTSEHPFTIGVFGHLRETKRIHVVIEAARKIGARLILAGAFASENLARSLARDLEQDWITHTGALSEAEYWRIAQDVDVCVNLKYPSALETSGVGIQLMGLGKPVIFTDGPELEHVPEHSCLRIPHGPEEGRLLTEHLRWLAETSDAARAIGANAQDFIRWEHGLETVTKRIADVLRSPPPPMLH